MSEPQGSLPFSGRTQISRHHSAMAAQDATTTRGAKTLVYMTLLKIAGEDGITDHEAARMTGWPLSSINSIRNGAGDLVEPAEVHGLSPYGKKVTKWRRNKVTPSHI
jgi:hypothetical protein